ncbi:hypothetical protein [Nocardia tengchongensis]
MPATSARASARGSVAQGAVGLWMVATALRALDRRNPPPSVVSGAANALSSGLPRILPRRTTIRVTRRLVAAK